MKDEVVHRIGVLGFASLTSGSSDAVASVTLSNFPTNNLIHYNEKFPIVGLMDVGS